MPRKRVSRFAAGVAAGVLVLAAGAAAGGASGAGGAGGGPRARPDGTGGAASPAARSALAAQRPSIVFVLTDDLAWNLVRFMPHVRDLQRRGVTFSRYFVTDSLCCPSRASIFTGKLPHNTGVFTNGGADGGFAVFHARGEERQTFAARLRTSGYLTAMMGKYLNGYVPAKPVDGRAAYVPPGWDEWDVAGNGYPEFDYVLNENGTLVRYGHDPEDYLTDVVAAKGAAFVERAARENKPFLLEIATFAPHGPFTPAPRDAADFPGLTAPRGPAFDEANVSDKPTWLRRHAPLTRAQLTAIDTNFRKRAQAVQAVDDLLATLEAALRRTGRLQNTYVVFTSDNGFHMGEHRLSQGKQTAFETDIRVPLVVAGPGVAHGVTRTRLASNVDLYPTFVRIGRARVPTAVDGRSLLPLLGAKPPARWRTGVLVEHHGPNTQPDDPDRPEPGSGNPPTYSALRTPGATYVEYAGGDTEYYDLRADPNQLANTAGRLTAARRKALHRQLAALVACRGSASCWRAGGGR